MKLFVQEAPKRVKIASVLSKQRVMLSRSLYAAIRAKSCATWRVPQEFEQIEPWGRAQLLTAIDLLAEWYKTEDVVFKELFTGWVHSRLVADLANEGAPADYKSYKALALVRDSWAKALQDHLPHDLIDVLSSDLTRVADSVSKPPVRRIRALFIGDCIQFETVTALMAPCAMAQIGVQTTVLNDRILPILRNRIRALNSDDFDIVFFSPFTHRNVSEYEALLNPKTCFWSVRRITRHTEIMMKDVFETLDVMAEHFSCPVYVHNTAGAIQSFGGVSGCVKRLISLRARTWARKLIRQGLSLHLQKPEMECRALLLDEEEIQSRFSDSQLGRVFVNSYALHPTRLGVELGRDAYFKAIYATTFLLSRKVIVCDLDNTIWDGVIGEGAVTQYVGRQSTLKELRRRGVLLSIASKNDSRNVNWAGSILHSDDFVAPRINWKSKAINIAEIRNELNLKTKDFVFIDDRPDELAIVREAFPDILALSALEKETWDLLGYWLRSLPSNPEEDRTNLYRDRAKREEFIKRPPATAESIESEEAALRGLKLSTTIRDASGADLKRVAELINRTNQFNLSGSRTTVKDLNQGLGVEHSVIMVEASDRFGAMGVVGIMRIDWKPSGVEIPIFVLSCRVFGFGIEYALLSALKALVPGDHVCMGHYKETQYNGPCKRLYPENGMEWDGTRWVGKVAALRPAPSWLSVHSELSPRSVSGSQFREVGTLPSETPVDSPR